MIDQSKIDAVLADPDWAERVVRAAARVVNALDNVPLDGKAAEGEDDPLLPVHSVLGSAFTAERHADQ